MNTGTSPRARSSKSPRARSSKTSSGVGRTLNERWRLGRLLGRGGFGVVFEGTDLETGDKVAIKLPLSRDMWDEFENESRMMSMAGSGAPRSYGIDRDESGYLGQPLEEGQGMPFLVMELLEGEDLHTLRVRRPLGTEEVLHYMNLALDGIDELHEHGIVHNDIKPANLFRTKNGEIKLLDFGMAMPFGTRQDARFGTRGFSAPEQIGRSPDSRPSKSYVARPSADVYALAATTYALLSRNPSAISDGVADCAETHDLDVLPDEPYQVSRAVTDAIQCEEAERTRTAAQFRKALNRSLNVPAWAGMALVTLLGLGLMMSGEKAST